MEEEEEEEEELEHEDSGGVALLNSHGPLRVPLIRFQSSSHPPQHRPWPIAIIPR